MSLRKIRTPCFWGRAHIGKVSALKEKPFQCHHFRLPFPVPDPIIEYKCSIAKDALMDVRVPEMIIKLKQGIGRLIRNFTDTGIVCIIDRRLRDEPPERYHDITWDSLPIKIGQAVWANLGSFTKVCPQPRNDDTNGSLFGNIEQPPKNDNQKTEVYHVVQ